MSRYSVTPAATSPAVSVFAAAIATAFVVAVGFTASTRLSSKQADAHAAEASEMVRPAIYRSRQLPTHRVPIGSDENGTTTVSA